MLHRECTKCHKSFPLNEKHFKKSPMYREGFKTWCIGCENAYRAAHAKKRYQKSAEYRRVIKERSKKWRAANGALIRQIRADRKAELKIFVAQYLAEHPCIDCGETDTVVLEFDHRDPRQKRFNVMERVSGGLCPAFYKEIAKCDIRCANCHRKRHAREFGHRAGYKPLNQEKARNE